ncbi:ATP-binding protein [Haloarcula pelagica]|uniref:ATP-binding protein n=1 Tax=Haloarcula pelagica TaxID=3033389 RepID=UPI0024C411F0|nr:ATP-binding protein [Halomicroarcula sp. YJ-61-S]
MSANASRSSSRRSHGPPGRRSTPRRRRSRSSTTGRSTPTNRGSGKLFENLFRNVDEHCEADVTVTVAGTDDGFVVEDTGPGLPESIAASLFDGDYTEGRRGLGLLIVERIVSGHGWSGAVESTTDGTRFVFGDIGITTTPSVVS